MSDSNYWSYKFFMLVILFVMVACNKDGRLGENYEGSLFELKSAESTGIEFSNDIIETEEFNHLMWLGIYLGGGVAIGDINNDGLSDIFFCGNKVKDRLYLNKGNLKFEDISEAAGIKDDKKWSAGVTMADVNGDGFLDIYVCRFGYSDNIEDRRNLLYINNQDNTFVERAKEYQLDNGGFSNQATFFDLDQDGDLDMYLVNQPYDTRIAKRKKIIGEPIDKQTSDRLYRNTGKGVFIDISEPAGVSNYAYGFTPIASDLNNDNWTDIYVSNDFLKPDHLYLNNGALKLEDNLTKSVKHISNFSMGGDIADFNNDGLVDIGVVDMASEDHYRSKTNMGSMSNKKFWSNVNKGNYYQFMINTLQLNNGNGKFSEIGQMSGISKTDWSWGFLFADLDNDEAKDIVITNGINRDIRNNDFQLNIRNQVLAGKTSFNPLDLAKTVPSIPLSNYVFKNNNDLTFSKKTKEWGFDNPGFSNGIAYGDLDNDGDLDLVINNVNSPASLYENKGGNNKNYIRFRLVNNDPNKFVLNTKVKLEYDGKIQFQELTLTRGYLSSSEPIMHFGMGDYEKVDKVTILWPNGKQTIAQNVSTNKVYTYQLKNASERTSTDKEIVTLIKENESAIEGGFQHQENEYDDFLRESLLPYKQSQNGPCITTGDVNGDGLDDFFVGGAIGQSGQLFIQSSDGVFKKGRDQVWSRDKAQEDLGALMFDYDGDQDLDLYVVSGGSEFEKGDELLQDRLYQNNGNGKFSKTKNVLPTLRESGQVVVANDIDKDGDLDLFLGGRILPGRYPYPPSSYLLENDNGKFVDVTTELASEFKELALVTDAIFSDYDVDGDLDLVVVGEGIALTLFANDNGSFSKIRNIDGLSKSVGLWWSISEGDLNEDGRPDYVLGNLGKNSKFKASEEKPFIVMGNDFDKNGSNDVILAGYYGEKLVPTRGRECTSEQMPFVADKYPSYDAFAKADIKTILTDDGYNEAVKFEVNNFYSSIALNLANDNFKLQPLPNKVQIAPIRSSICEDINKDGHLDILVTGNLYGAEVETVRYDAGIGAVMIGDGKGGFTPLSPIESGFYTPYDARDLAMLKGKNGESIILVGNNNEKIQAFYFE